MTRLALVGAPLAIAAAIVFGGGGSDVLVSDAPVEGQVLDAEQPKNQQKPKQLKQPTDSDKKLEARIAKMPPGLAAPRMKEIASQIVSSAENSTLNWRGQYGSIEDIGDGCGYTAGVIGFCSGTNDMLQLVEAYTKDHPDNPLAAYLPALRAVDGTASHEGLDPGFKAAWAKAAESPAFRTAQDKARDRIYFQPAVRMAKMDGLGTLGQFIYYDAMVLHGPGIDPKGFYGIRKAAMRAAPTAAEGGKEQAYLNAFLDSGRAVMKVKKAHQDTSRIDTAQRVFLRNGNLELRTPLVWQMYGETFRIPAS
ncbi:chitosanase [Streptomyces sp. ISL-98]|uniref:chitosanase n=1 Tax=Streptomyces sp. ISL-98 TaxID=2819192 RepID=UPI00203535DC|nr:chitosanase [Streptomyces sp. ISL-98]